MVPKICIISLFFCILTRKIISSRNTAFQITAFQIMVSWSWGQFYPRRGAPQPRTRFTQSVIASCLMMVISNLLSLNILNILNPHSCTRILLEKAVQCWELLQWMEFGLYVKREKTRKAVDIWYTQWVYCSVVCLYHGDTDMIIHTICLAYVHACMHILSWFLLCAFIVPCIFTCKTHTDTHWESCRPTVCTALHHQDSSVLLQP